MHRASGHPEGRATQSPDTWEGSTGAGTGCHRPGCRLSLRAFGQCAPGMQEGGRPGADC